MKLKAKNWVFFGFRNLILSFEPNFKNRIGYFQHYTRQVTPVTCKFISFNFKDIL